MLMAVTILFVDIRDKRKTMEAHCVHWDRNLSAQDALKSVFSSALANEIILDLEQNNPEIIVSWHDADINEHSEIGGVGDLNWHIPDGSTVTIVYENQQTSEAQIDRSSDWMIAQQNKCKE